MLIDLNSLFELLATHHPDLERDERLAVARLFLGMSELDKSFFLEASKKNEH